MQKEVQSWIISNRDVVLVVLWLEHLLTGKYVELARFLDEFFLEQNENLKLDVSYVSEIPDLLSRKLHLSCHIKWLEWLQR